MSCSPENLLCFDDICTCVPPPPEATPSYVSTSTLSVGDSKDQFIDLAFAIPYLAGTIDADLSAKLSKAPLELSLDPKFFQLPYIYSFATNLSKGKYSSTFIKDDDKETVTSYVVPYKSEFSEKTVTIVTTLVKETNILFHEIPREFSYDSAEQASVATSMNADGTFEGIYLVPKSFIDGELNSGTIKYEFKINPKTDTIVEAKPNYYCPNGDFTNLKKCPNWSSPRVADVSVSSPLGRYCIGWICYN
jgi:hypothetical protein